MKEKTLNIQLHIQAKQIERDRLLWLWSRIEDLNIKLGLSESTYEELQAKISSEINQCDNSIQHHEKLIQ